MALSPTPILQLYKIDPDTDNVDVETDFNNNMDKIEGMIPTLFVATRTSGTQTGVAGDQLLQFPTIQKANPNFVTPSGTGNTNFLLQPGIYSLYSSCRFDNNADAQIYFCTGTTANEGNNFGFGNPVLAFVSCSGSAALAISAPTTINITLWIGAAHVANPSVSGNGTTLRILRHGPFN